MMSATWFSLRVRGIADHTVAGQLSLDHTYLEASQFKGLPPVALTGILAWSRGCIMALRHGDGWRESPSPLRTALEPRVP